MPQGLFVSDAHPSVLVLGGTGMLGHAVVDHFASAGLDVHASIRSDLLVGHLNPATHLHDFDATRDTVATLIESIRPTTVVNCIGLVKQLEAASRPLPAIRLNSLFPHEAAAACEAVGARLIHISTDCVFSGLLPIGEAYTEQDQPDAHDLYGLTKHLGEVNASQSLTLRTSIIGWELGRSTGLLEWFAAQNGGRVDGFTHAVFSGLTTQALARVIGSLTTEHPRLGGLYHVSSEPITKYELLRALRHSLALDIEILPVDEPMINRALDSTRLHKSTGLTVPSWEEMLSEYTRGKVSADDAG
ncbi:MAG TPA: SDR family oxidoreductase [Solirubrobacteraceae bacterium]|jgi:dTDP-4-dehydrorhamnose reductase|nr:SDR family oxidoreductase [Solirubrobacteraceae bacterium]